jgi:serine/threonine-protein kinase RsbW
MGQGGRSLENSLTQVTFLTHNTETEFHMRRHEPLQLAATVENLPRFREYVETACTRDDIDAEASFALKLAVDEACSNIIEHGYGDSASGTIEVTFESSDETAQVTIVDTGRSFSPERAPRPDLEADWQERPIGGLGWHLIRSVMDEIRYHTEGPENRLTLIKRIDAGSEPRRREERSHEHHD